MKGRFISLKEVVNRVHLLGGDIVDDVTDDDIITYTIELLGVVGMSQLFEQKEDVLEIKKYKALLPCDFVEIRQAKCCDKAMNPSTDLYDVRDSKTNVPTYKIQGDYITTSIEEGFIKIAYTAVKVDEDGYPMIVDNQSFIRALVSYIVYKRVYTNYINGRLPNENIMERVERDYEFNIAQATHQLSTPSPEEFSNITRLMNTFLFRRDVRDNGYKDIGDENPINQRTTNVANLGFIRPNI